MPQESQMVNLKRVAVLCAALALGLSAMALVGWIFDVRSLSGVRIDWIPMAPSTAVSFILLNVSLIAFVKQPLSGTIRNIGISIAVMVMIFGLIILIEDVAGTNKGIERYLVAEPAVVGEAEEGRMSPLTAIAFVLAASSLFFLALSRERLSMKSTASILSILSWSIALIAALGYLYGSPLLYGGSTVPMALTTSISFIFTGIALTASAGIDSWPINSFAGQSMSARLMRVFLPLTLATVIFQGWLQAILHIQLGVQAAIVSALSLIIIIFLVVIVVMKVSKSVGGSVDRAIEERAEVERNLFNKTLDLGERIKELKCLYHASGSINNFNLSTDEILSEIVHSMPAAWLYPEMAVARIVLQGKVFSTGEWPDNPWKQSAEIYVSGKIRGEIEVSYLEERPERDEGPFLAEERKLIDTLAEQIGMMVDRKRAEELAMVRHHQLQSIMDNAPVYIYLVDSEGRIIMVNRMFKEGFEQNQKQIIGESIYDLLHGTKFDDLHESIRHVIDKQTPVTLENEIELPDGSSPSMLSTIFPLLGSDGLIYGVCAIMSDVTELSQMEKQLVQAQKMEAVGRLAGGVAHDFNNILCVIIGYAELTRGNLESADPAYQDITEIISAGRRATDITRHLLAFSRQQVTEPRIINLNDVVNNMYKTLSRIIGEDINIVLELEEDLHQVKCDPTEIDQIILNLGTNARDAMPKGGELKIETQNVDIDVNSVDDSRKVFDAVSYVSMKVTDNGIGMDEETLSHMYEPFFTTKSEEKGTGLGLATVFGIVEKAGGKIEVSSMPGKGTTFEIHFPKCDEEEETITSDLGHKPELTGTVLLVEDDNQVRKVTKRILEMNGFTVIESSLPTEAIEIHSSFEKNIDLLLTDVIMPGMSGKDLSDLLVEKQPDLKTLYMSGYTSGEISERGVAASGAIFIQKPFLGDDLIKKVVSVLR